MEEHREHREHNGPNTPQQTDTPPEAAAPETPPPENKTGIQRLYDKIPLTFRQADILVKVLIGLFVLVLIIGIATGSRFGG